MASSLHISPILYYYNIEKSESKLTKLANYISKTKLKAVKSVLFKNLFRSNEIALNHIKIIFHIFPRKETLWVYFMILMCSRLKINNLV